MSQSIGFAPRARRWVALVMIAFGLPVFSSGCFGTFQLTRKVYQFNRTVSPDKWVRWVAFLAMNVVPVYGFSAWIDVLFANSVEFWTGSNPITAQAGASRVAFGPSGEMATATRLADGSIQLEIRDTKRALHVFRFTRLGDALVAFGPQGEELARIADLDARPRLVQAPR